MVDLASPKYADLDGDGLTDLWGEVDGELRAFRGEAPEAWRALGRFDRAGSYRGEGPAARRALERSAPAGSSQARSGIVGNGMVDFDGDGVADTLIGGLEAPGNWNHETTGSHTAVARSGRDGRVIWKTEIDPRKSWFDPNSGDTYDLVAFPLPAGDLDGDGTADVIVKKTLGAGNSPKQPASTLAIELLSGRTGASVWSGGALPGGLGTKRDAAVDWIEPRVVDANGKPDLIVGYSIQGSRCDLARVSGRDGRILWDVPISEDTTLALLFGKSLRYFEDLDGDGGIDALVVLPRLTAFPRHDYTTHAVSLRDGKRLWLQTLQFEFPFDGEIHVGDVDGDKRPDVVALEDFSDGNEVEPRIRVFDGRDGKLRWTWKLLAEPFSQRRSRVMALANFGGDGTRDICISFQRRGKSRIVVLDGSGKERVRRDVTAEDSPNLNPVDLDGDGRDELLLNFGGLVHAWDRDLKKVWLWPSRFGTVDQIVPAAAGRPREVVLPPGAGFDAATGQPRWTGQAPLVESPPQFMPKLLDPGDSTRLPLLIGDGLGTTVCRVAMPTMGDGSIASARGNRVQVGLPRADPRWARPLPWRNWLTGAIGPWCFFASGALAFVNVVLPLLILRLAVRRRRFFNIRALMILPLAVAVPLMSFLTVAPWLPVWSSRWLSSESRVFLAGTVAGLPIVYFVVWMGASLARRRWKPALALASLTLVTTLAVAGGWVWRDMKAMPAIEYYRWERWELVLLPGAYAAAVLWIVGRGAVGSYRLVTRRGQWKLRSWWGSRPGAAASRPHSRVDASN